MSDVDAFESLFNEAPEEEEAESVLPGYHQARSRVQRLPETRITASPEGGGTIRGGLGTEDSPQGTVETVEDAELPGIYEKDAPAAPPGEAEYRAAVRAREDAADPSGGILSDFMEGVVPLPSGGRHIRQRAERTAEDVGEDPAAVLWGATEAVPWFDEILGGIAQTPATEGESPLIDLPGSPGRYGTRGSRAGIVTESRPGSSYEEVRDSVRESVEDAQERSPYAFGAGELAGMLGTAPLLAEETAGEAALTGAQRIGRAAREGALMGGLYGSGASEAEGDELLGDTALGAVGGGVVGGLVGTGAEGVRAGGRALRELAEGADLARVASVAPGRTISRTDPTIQQFSSMPGGVQGQAQRLRRMRIVSPAATSRDVFERAGSEYERVGDEVLGPIRERIAEAGPVRTWSPQPRQEGAESGVVDSLRQYAEELARSPDATDRALAPSVRSQVDAMLDAWGPETTYQEAEAQLRRMGQRTRWTDPATGQQVSPPTEVRQEVYRRLRAALDDIAEGRVGPEERARFQEGRLDAQTARTARDLAESRMGREAQSAPIGLIDSQLATAAGAAGGGPATAAAVAAASRGLRSRSGAIRATGLDLVRSLLESGAARRLGTYGPILERALRRGGAAFTAAHGSLMRSDPEYRAIVEEAESAPAEMDPDEAAAFEDMFNSLPEEEVSP